MVTFKFTNESLKAIYAGMNPSKEDNILMICGSGDQAFCCAETNARIAVVDYKEEQVNFAKKRANFLRKQDYPSFLTLETGELPLDITPSGPEEYFLRSRNRYFSKERLEKITETLSNNNSLIFGVGNLLSTPLYGKGYNKLYLSNIIGYGNGLKLKPEKMKSIFESMYNLVNDKGIVYISDGDKICRLEEENEGFLKKSGFKTHEKLTKRARIQQNKENSEKVRLFPELKNSGTNWNPLILQKI